MLPLAGGSHLHHHGYLPLHDDAPFEHLRWCDWIHGRSVRIPVSVVLVASGLGGVADLLHHLLKKGVALLKKLVRVVSC